MKAQTYELYLHAALYEFLFFINIYDLRQGVVLQLIDSVGAPSQSAPPLLGGGFVQVLCLNLVPPPHVALQSP